MQGGDEESWVTKFAVQSSKNGKDWRYVNEEGLTQNLNPLVFGGNQDGSSIAEVR